MTASIRLAVAGIFHETNTFAPGKTDMDCFKLEWTLGYEAFASRYAGTRTTMGGVLASAERFGFTLVPGLYTYATPGGIVDAATGDALLRQLVESIDPMAEGILLILHGAMVTELYPDFEGECVQRIRERFGPDIPVCLTLDLHANISRRMVEQSSLIVGYDTYPHIDMFERAVQAAELLLKLTQNTIKPVQAYAHTRMLIAPQAMLTEEGVMRELMRLAFELENMSGVLNITVAGGFPYSDVYDAGMTFVVTADGDTGVAERCAEELVRFAAERRSAFRVPMLPPQEAIREALAEPEGPVILAEGSDNTGGGSPADATHLLAHLTNVPERALIVVADPEAVNIACRSGIDGPFEALVGGKRDTLHGAPVPLAGVVRHLFDGRYRHIGPYMTGQLARMGRTAVVECGMLTVVLTERRVPPWDLGHIQSVGLRPEDFKIIVAKSAIAWQTAFGPYAKRVIHVDSPGCCSANVTTFAYRNVCRPIFPLDTGKGTAPLLSLQVHNLE